MNQAMSLAVQNEGEISSWGLGSSGTGAEKTDEEEQNSMMARAKFLDIITKYLKYTKYTPIESDATKYERHSLDGTKFSYFAPLIVLADGTNIIGATITSPNCTKTRGPSAAFQNICGEFFIDLNGRKGPNATGKDIFIFYYNKFGNFTPVGNAQDTHFSFDGYCNKTKQDNLNGYGCTAWIMYNENMDYLHCDDLSWNGKRKCK